MSIILPRSLLPKVKHFYEEHIPYAYCTVKRKCYKNHSQLVDGSISSGPGGAEAVSPFNCFSEKTCTKEKHACFRTIVSFKKMPGRLSFKRVGRALQFLTASIFPSRLSVSNLSVAKSDIEDRLKLQKPRKPLCNEDYVHCKKCKDKMYHPTLYTADAGQEFEVITNKKVQNSLSAVFRLASSVTKMNDPTITVLHSIKSQVSFGGQISDKIADLTVFFASKIRRCIEGVLKMKTFKAGNLFLTQQCGIPIGGPISGGVLDLVLSHCETTVCVATPKKRF